MKFDGAQYQHAFVRKHPSQWLLQVWALLGHRWRSVSSQEFAKHLALDVSPQKRPTSHFVRKDCQYFCMH